MNLPNLSYPIAPNGVLSTIQGEGPLLGVPMVFVRLAGCSVGCPQCDTDYSISRRLSALEIGVEVDRVRTSEEWVWVTGGEPADHDLWPLLEVLRLRGHVALCTSGSKNLGAGGRLVEFLSVSPHGKPSELVLARGSSINLVPGLNGLCLDDWGNFPADLFQHRFVTPCDGIPGTVRECVEFVRSHKGWRLGCQAHKTWGLP